MDTPGFEPGPSEHEFGALPTELSDISTNKFLISHSIGSLALGAITAYIYVKKIFLNVNPTLGRLLSSQPDLGSFGNRTRTF